MFQGHKILAFVGARGGSKGLKRKNVALLKGKPLIGWTLEAIFQSKWIDHIIVSTDDAEIARVVHRYGLTIPFRRPLHLAKDNASLYEAIDHCLKWLDQNHQNDFDTLICLQPTSPLRTTEHIDEALQYYFKKRIRETDTLVSVKKMSEKIGWLMRSFKQQYVQFCLDQNSHRRQLLPTYYLPNGAIYVSDIQSLRKSKSFYKNHVLPYVMSEKASIDIDSKADLNQAIEYLNEGHL